MLLYRRNHRHPRTLSIAELKTSKLISKPQTIAFMRKNHLPADYRIASYGIFLQYSSLRSASATPSHTPTES